jgi:hypothetical protein
VPFAAGKDARESAQGAGFVAWGRAEWEVFCRCGAVSGASSSLGRFRSVLLRCERYGASACATSHAVRSPLSPTVVTPTGLPPSALLLRTLALPTLDPLHRPGKSDLRPVRYRQ